MDNDKTVNGSAEHEHISGFIDEVTELERQYVSSLTPLTEYDKIAFREGHGNCSSYGVHFITEDKLKRRSCKDCKFYKHCLSCNE